MLLAKGRNWEMGKMEEMIKLVKRYKVSVKGQINPGEVIYSMVTTVNNTVLYT